MPNKNHPQNTIPWGLNNRSFRVRLAQMLAVLKTSRYSNGFCPLLSSSFSLFVVALLGSLLTLPIANGEELLFEDTRQPEGVNIDLLIAQLGHDSFAVRERAQRNLARLGAAAFDALLVAQENDDIEIAHRARFLFQQIVITWTRPTDPKSVERLLDNYSDHNRSDRRARIANLAALDHQIGIEALCRIVRFDRSEVISKEAALAILNLAPLTPSSEKASLSEHIIEAIDGSPRQGADWLRAYASLLAGDDYSNEIWGQFLEEEAETLAQNPLKSSPQLKQDLIRWNIDQLLAAGRIDDAQLVMENTLGGREESKEELRETIDWLIDREAFSLVVRLVDSFPRYFSEDATLQYRLAEVNLALEQPDIAHAQSERALEIGGDDFDAHELMAFQLRSRGLFDWATKEYRYVIEASTPGSLNAIRARISLSELLHSRLDERGAASLLQEVVDASEASPAVLRMIQEKLYYDVDLLRSRMHYFSAMDFAASGDEREQQNALDAAVQFNPLDSDILIALYRLEGDDADHRASTMAHLNRAIEQFDLTIRRMSQQYNFAQNDSNERVQRDALAYYLNTYAWLVANTEGNYQQALAYSLQSLQIKPDSAGYLDTLGRCFYAVGDFTEAVATQRRAVALEPHSILMKRQLDLFEAALAKERHE